MMTSTTLPYWQNMSICQYWHIDRRTAAALQQSCPLYNAQHLSASQRLIWALLVKSNTIKNIRNTFWAMQNLNRWNIKM
jgi:hypothetical protein